MAMRDALASKSWLPPSKLRWSAVDLGIVSGLAVQSLQPLTQGQVVCHRFALRLPYSYNERGQQTYFCQLKRPIRVRYRARCKPYLPEQSIATETSESLGQ
jgi:hypothetical protein